MIFFIRQFVQTSTFALSPYTFEKIASYIIGGTISICQLTPPRLHHHRLRQSLRRLPLRHYY